MRIAKPWMPSLWRGTTSAIGVEWRWGGRVNIAESVPRGRVVEDAVGVEERVRKRKSGVEGVEGVRAERRAS